MKILNEAKEKLPSDYMTNFVSDAWNEVGRLQGEIKAISKEFKDTDAVEAILQSLLDAYYIAIGQMQSYLKDENYVDIPEDASLTEKLTLNEAAPAPKSEAPAEEDDGKIKPIQPLQKPQAPAAANKKPAEANKPASPAKPEDKPADEVKESVKSEPADFFVDFDEPAPDADADRSIHEWFTSRPQE